MDMCIFLPHENVEGLLSEMMSPVGSKRASLLVDGFDKQFSFLFSRALGRHIGNLEALNVAVIGESDRSKWRLKKTKRNQTRAMF